MNYKTHILIFFIMATTYEKKGKNNILYNTAQKQIYGIN
jgi:membrane-bound metal-dependent hydrolase YbcI (DUF457 family)